MKSFLFLILGICALAHADESYLFEGDPRFKESYMSHQGRLDVVASFIGESPVIFEAGGHYGVDTVQFAEKWPQAKIISFEPNPHAFEIFQQATLGIDSIHGYNLAVYDTNGTATLRVCYGSTGDQPIFEGASSLLEPTEEMRIHYQGPLVEVPCVRLDDWCMDNHVAEIDFMWLDLEGVELQVLRSSPQILSTVKVIYTETNHYPFREGITRYEDLRAFLEASGFRLVAHWYHKGFQGDAVFVRN